MMVFLIEYDRASGSLVTLESYDGTKREQAERARLEMELDINQRGVDREVVLLEAESEEALLRTHRRYFEGLAELVKPAG